MTVTIEELGRRAAACKAWPGYLPGMADVDGYRVLSCYDCGTYRIAQDGDAFDSDVIASPDLYDRATLALLRDIVARAYGGTQCTVDYQVPYTPGTMGYLRITNDAAKTLYQDFLKLVTDYPVAEALVCALEAAPEAP